MKSLLRLLCFLIVLCIATGVNAAPTQWKVGEGGSGNWYEVVTQAEFLTWTQAKTSAEANIFSGVQGALASITSQAENDFVSGLFAAKDWVYNGTNGFMGPWIGGYQPTGSGAWAWTTGEEWGFTAWESNQPSNQSGQNFIHYYVKLASSGNPLNEDATWNDYADSLSSNKVFGYVVEYETVPLPGALLLLCSGLVGFAGIRRKRG